ncbi:MAG: methylated-DNA--[protein]-cysteine S-methyltransferase [Clostridiaceae bacterium]|nr:methylated-DNA--[protein]-cysteine S-methyltransferase [Clostridiaceae bacterium]
MKYLFFYDTKLGKIGIAEENSFITNVYFSSEEVPKDIEVFETPLIKEAAKQLTEYLSTKRRTFDLPLSPRGTQFQKMVWKELEKISYGKTLSYKEVAQKVGNEKACRAVGMANNKNPIPIFIPCHRVIGANGKLIGYGGGLNIKSWLLKLENVVIR